MPICGFKHTSLIKVYNDSDRETGAACGSSSVMMQKAGFGSGVDSHWSIITPPQLSRTCRSIEYIELHTQSNDVELKL